MDCDFLWKIARDLSKIINMKHISIALGQFKFRLNCWTCTLLIFGAGLLAILGASSSANADDCPPNKECSLIERAYQGCSKNKADDCVRFVRHFSNLSALTCGKKSELDSSSEKKVPAIQICDAHKDFTLANYTEMLASMSTPDAQKFFSSEKFRQAVKKTPVGEEYMDRSKELEQKLAENAKPKSKKDKATAAESSSSESSGSDSDRTFKKANTNLGSPDDPVK